MQNLETRSLALSNSHKSFLALFTVFSFLGFLDAAYLTVQHYRHVIPACSVLHGCEKVLTSSYATIGHVPIALLGAAFYLSVFVLALIAIDFKRPKLLGALSALAIPGAAASWGLFFVQAAVLKAYCLYCLASLTFATILFILGMSYFVYMKRRVST